MSIYTYEITIIKENDIEDQDKYIIHSTSPYQAFADVITQGLETELDPNIRYSISIHNPETEGVTIFHITQTMPEDNAISYFEGYLMEQQK